MYVRTSCRGSSHSPLCAWSDPQQACSGDETTSQPLRASASTVSRFTSLNIRSCAQPVSTATRYFPAPTAGGDGENKTDEKRCRTAGGRAYNSRRGFGRGLRMCLRRKNGG